MTEQSHQSVLTFGYEDASRAAVIAASIRREAGEIGDTESTVIVERSNTTVTVHLTAPDLVGLRAATNTWSNLVGVAEETTCISKTDA